MDQSQDVRAAGGSGEHSGLGPESAAGSPLRDGDEVEATQCAPEEESFISTQREALPAIWMAPVQDVAACAEPFVLNPDAATTVGALRSTGGVHTGVVSITGPRDSEFDPGNYLSSKNGVMVEHLPAPPVAGFTAPTTRIFGADGGVTHLSRGLGGGKVMPFDAVLVFSAGSEGAPVSAWRVVVGAQDAAAAASAAAAADAAPAVTAITTAAASVTESVLAGED